MKQSMMDRRTALGAFGLLGGTLVLACKGDDGSSLVDAASTDGSAASGDAACAETLEGEVGPYFADDSADGFNRSDVTANLDGTSVQTGIPLALTFYIYDSENGCNPYVGAQVDIWHCNASGIYSDISSENTSSEQWLRGYQITDSTGKIAFTTIFPGWYDGRTTHVHLRIRSSYDEDAGLSDGTNTTQVFFPQTLVDTISTTISPYDTEGTNPTTNATDRVYAQQTLGQNLLSLTGDTTSGFSASFSIYLPIDNGSGSGSGGGMGSGGPGSGGMGSGGPGSGGMGSGGSGSGSAG
jgi:protocatechuate 3,4-dioxygenase beta subunit